jgi:hypothetical protein
VKLKARGTEKRYYVAKEAHPMPRNKVAEKVPKIAPLVGYLRAQFIKCGRSNCHCLNTKGHGPYYYHVVTMNGHKRKKYVKQAELSVVQAGIDERRKQLAEVRQINHEAKESWQTFKAQMQQLNQLMRLAGYDV